MPQAKGLQVFGAASQRWPTGPSLNRDQPVLSLNTRSSRCGASSARRLAVQPPTFTGRPGRLACAEGRSSCTAVSAAATVS